MIGSYYRLYYRPSWRWLGGSFPEDKEKRAAAEREIEAQLTDPPRKD